MTLVLRDYQDEAIQSMFDYFEGGNTGNPIIALPTGTGKALVNAGMVQRIVQTWPSQRIMCLTHVKELIEQNYLKLGVMWPEAPTGVYSAGMKRKDTTQNIIFAGIQSVAKKAFLFGHIDLIIIDECHLVSPNAEASYGKFIEDLKLANPYLKVIGLTATPYRLKLGLLTNGQIFTDICLDKTSGEDFVWFVEQGYLSNLLPKPTKTQFDLEGVKKRGGEFIAGDLQGACDKEGITFAAVAETYEVGMANTRLKWMFFTTGEKHGQHVTDCLRDIGIEVRFVHSKMAGGDSARAEAIKWFCEPGNFVKALVNIDTLTTGFDCPDLDLLVILRPTMSPGLWVQILGRGTRPAYATGFDLLTQQGRLAAIAAGPKPNCMVLDFAGNTARLGPINRVEIPLPPGKKGGGEAPARLCPEDEGGCNTWVWAASITCEHCGFEFPPPKHKLNAGASTATLVAGVGTEAEYEVLTPDSVAYSLHKSRRGTTSLKVMYMCGITVHTKYHSFDDANFAGVKAREWWRAAADMRWLQLPTTCAEALNYAHQKALREPKFIRVRIDTKYPEITDYHYE